MDNSEEDEANAGSKGREIASPRNQDFNESSFAEEATSPTNVATSLNSNAFKLPESEEKKKRLNAELLRLSSEIHFEKQVKPVRIQQVQAFNPFKNLVTPSEPAQTNSVNWEEMAKLWMKSVEDSSNVCNQLEEYEKNKRSEEAESQKRLIEEQIQKKKEAAQAIVEKMLNAQKQKEVDNKIIKEERMDELQETGMLSGFHELPVEAHTEIKEGNHSVDEHINNYLQNSSPERYRSCSRTDSRSRSRSWSSRSRRSSSTHSRSPHKRRSRSRSRRLSPQRRRSRSRERRNYGRHEASAYFRRLQSRGRRGYGQNRRAIYRRNNYSAYSPPQYERRRIRYSVERMDRERSYSDSPKRSESPKDKVTSHVVILSEKDTKSEVKPIVPDPPIPHFEQIDELIYLDDKVTKLGKKVKRPIEEQVECDCFERDLNCSDNRCINRHMLVECRKCRVPTCQNQQFRNRQYSKIAPFYTGPQKGFGIKALEKIKRDRFIIEYIGEVVTNEEFSERAIRYSKDPKHTHHYIFELGQKLIDATVKGNFSRFINHSCEPNAVCLKWAVPKTPKDCPRIGFFAKRDILPGEEITFDYQFLNYGKKAQSCHCGAPSCKGVIGQTIDENEEDIDDEEDVDEEESDYEEETEEDRLHKEQEAEYKEWESQYKINEIISAGTIPQGKRFNWAGKLVKNLMKVDEIGYKLRVLSFIRRVDKHFYCVLKKKSLFDVFASWLSPSNWSKEDMELKLELLRFLVSDASETYLIQGENSASGWTALSVQAVDNLAISDVPSVLVIRDTVEFLVDSVCGDKTEEDDEEELQNMSYESLFAGVQEAARLLRDNTQFIEGRRRCAISKYKIPKKVKEEREAAAQNPTSSCKNQTKDVRRTERRDDYFARNRYYRYDSYSYGSRYSLKRRYDSYRKGYDYDYKRSRYGDRYERDHHRQNERYRDNRSPERELRRRNQSNDAKPRSPRTPPFDRHLHNGKTSRSNYHHERSSLKEPGLVDPKRSQMVVQDMDLSDGSPKTPAINEDSTKATDVQNSSLQIDVAGSPFVSNPLLASTAYINSLNMQMFPSMYNAIPHVFNENYLKCSDNWASKITDAQLTRQYSQVPFPQLIQLKNYFERSLKSITEIEEVHKKNLPAKSDANMPPPPPPKKQALYCRLKAAEGDYYYWNKNTNEVSWELPEGESFDDYDNNPLPDSSAEVEEKPNISMVNDEERPPSQNSASRPSSQNSFRPSSRASIEANQSNEYNDKHSKSDNKKLNSVEFQQSIEKAIEPVVDDCLRKVSHVDKDKRKWLLTLLAKDLHRRETTRDDCSYTMNQKLIIKMSKFVKDYIERKSATKELFKKYERHHPSKSDAQTKVPGRISL